MGKGKALTETKRDVICAYNSEGPTATNIEKLMKLSREAIRNLISKDRNTERSTELGRISKISDVTRRIIVLEATESHRTARQLRNLHTPHVHVRPLQRLL